MNEYFLKIIFGLPLIVCCSALMESYTIKGVKCMSACTTYSNYQFCYLGWGSSNWDYCTVGTTSAPQYFTSLNKGNVPKCTSHCGNFGYDYNWCFIGAGGEWDYCSPKYNSSVYGRPCIHPCRLNRSGTNYACQTAPSSPYLNNFVPVAPEDIALALAVDDHMESCAPSPINLSEFDAINRAILQLRGEYLSSGYRTCPVRHKRLSENVVRNIGVEELARHYESLYPSNIVPYASQNQPVLSFIGIQAPPLPGLLNIRLTLVIRARIYPRHLGNIREDLPSFVTRRMTDMNGLPGDERGHLIASQFSGPTHDFNFVPQSTIVNRNYGGNSYWFRVEAEIRGLLQLPNAGYVQWTIVVAYGDLTVSRRPTGFALRFISYDNNNQQIRDSGNCYFSNDPNGGCPI